MIHAHYCGHKDADHTGPCRNDGLATLSAVVTKEEVESVRILSEEEKQTARLGQLDMVNHPPHYKGPQHGCGKPIECIDVVRDKPFNIGNAIKYLWRAGRKDDHLQDLRKAVWYIQDEIKRLEAQR